MDGAANLEMFFRREEKPGSPPHFQILQLPRQLEAGTRPLASPREKCRQPGVLGGGPRRGGCSLGSVGGGVQEVSAAPAWSGRWMCEWEAVSSPPTPADVVPIFSLTQAGWPGININAVKLAAVAAGECGLPW